MCGMCRVADADGLVLDKGGGGPRDIVVLMLSGARAEVEDGSPEKRADNGLLERGDDARVDGCIHESILDGVKALGENVVVPRETHVACYRGRRLIRLSGG